MADAWRNLDDPSPELRQAARTAIAVPGAPEVRVRFSDDEIVGLVITG